MGEMSGDSGRSSREEAIDLLRAELQRMSAELGDIASKIESSRGNVDSLAQKNAMVMGEVRKVEGALEETPRPLLKETYTEALNSQQRLMTIRAQMEKLQAQDSSVRQSLSTVKTALDLLGKDAGGAGGRPGALNPRETIIKVIDAEEEERDRLARQLHDGPAHSLTNFILQAEICQKLFDKNPDKARQELANLMGSAREAFQRVRDFIFDLRPMMLGDLGLVPTLKRYVETFKDKSGIETELVITASTEGRPDRYLEVLIFRGVQELMLNARDHGGASHIKLTLEMGNDRIRVIVEDNGRGFGTGKLTLDAASSKSLGLSTLQDRVNLVGGRMQIDSVPGQGARIELDVPAARVADSVSADGAPA